MVVKLNLKQDKTMSWDGYYETDDDMIHILIEDLTFSGETFACEWTDEEGKQIAIDGVIG